MIRSLAAAAVLALVATPAFADPNCLMSGGPGLRISGQIGIGEFSESDIAEFDKMRLRQAGIDADSVERTWLGCLKVTSRDSGGWNTDYYDPQTFERKPLNLRLP